MFPYRCPFDYIFRRGIVLMRELVRKSFFNTHVIVIQYKYYIECSASGFSMSSSVFVFGKLKMFHDHGYIYNLDKISI